MLLGRGKDAVIRGLIVAVALLSPAAAALLYWIEPTDSSWYPKCFLHLLTGLHCPFCGTTRAGHALLGGDLGQAVAYNALSLVVFPLLALWLYWSAFCVLRKRELPRVDPPRWFMRAFIVFLFAFWIARNLPFFPFDLLAPHRL
jgi:hypothetical protein